MNNMEQVTFQTQDGVVIVGDYTAAGKGPVAILLHMMPTARSSWNDFAKKLNTARFTTLAIDLRGHGESTKTTEGKTLDYKKFSDLEHQASIKDVEAAYLWLEREYGTAPEEVAVIGASIGANLSLQYLAQNHGVPAAVLLSPGLDYKGLETEPLVGELRPNQAVFYAAAKDDAYSHETVTKLHGLTEVAKEVKTYNKAGHGTNMFTPHPELMDEIVGWLKERF